MNSEKINRFEQSFEKGLKGSVKNFEIWLKNQNYDISKMNLDKIDSYFKNNIEIIPNHEKELNLIAEFLGYYSRDKSHLYYIPIIGVSGVGKTLFLKTLFIILNNIKYQLNIEFYDASKYDNDKYYEKIYQKLSNNIDILFIDSCEQYLNIIGITDNFARKMNNGIIIAAWNPEKYIFYRDDIKEKYTIFKEFNLEPINVNDCKKTVIILLNYFSFKDDQNSIIINNLNEELANRIFQKLFDYCKGVPRILVELLLKSFEEAYLKEKTAIDEEIIDFTANSLGLKREMKFEYLSDILTKILKIILNSKDERGIRPMLLVEELQLNKSTISYHLSTLKKEKIVYSEKIGRSTFYNIRPEVKPFIQIYISQRSEFNA